MKKFILLITLSLFTTPAYTANFIEYGFTPSHVHALWTNIHQSIVKLSEKYPLEVQEAIKNIPPTTYRDKIPADVLNETNIFTRKLNSYREYYNLPSIDLKSMETDSNVTPSTVYVNSGRLQDALAYTISTANPSQEISSLYHGKFIEGKEPRDVFSLVELAIKKLNILIDYEKSQH